jgi:hypothetical protein
MSMRAVGGIIAGLIAGLIVAVVVGIVAMATTFTLPPGTDAAHLDKVLQTVMVIPQATQLALAAAWFAGALVGTAVAKLIARRAWAAWAVGLVLAAYFGLSALDLALPLWVTASWAIAPLLGALLGGRLVRAGPAVVTAETEAPPANP